MKVKIKCWNGVATWLWVANDENCGICRMAFNGCCRTMSVPAAVSRAVCLSSGLGVSPKYAERFWGLVFPLQEKLSEKGRLFGPYLYKIPSKVL